MAKEEEPPQFDYQYRWIENVESLEKYVPGGYHPVMIGDVVKNRYQIVHKLGFGGYSTVWLARDTRHENYVALKIGASSSRLNETAVMDVLSSSKPSPSENSAAAFGAGAIPALLDQFTIQGPNGAHPCYTTAVAECNVRDSAFRGKMFKLQVARALAVKLVSAVAYTHSQGYVHGDIHLGNVMLRLHSGLNNLSVDQLYTKYGHPETIDISRFDDGALPPNIPTRAVRSLQLGKAATKISLNETNLLLVDFGESFAPAKTSRLCEDCRSHLANRPPEWRFEPKSPLSFSVDIWCLGIALWDLFALRTLFSAEFIPPDSVVAQHVDILGPMPPQWWKQWEQRLEYFDEEGHSTQGNGAAPPLDKAFDVWTQKERKLGKVGVFSEHEATVFLALLRRMMSLDPRGRPTAQEVLQSEWVKTWAMPDFLQSLAEVHEKNGMPQ